jgi:2-oxoglutarate ferredoxin oxidoreductase subunit alpha
MAEVPLVIINVQRGGPSTGLPTKVEQGDLLQAIFATHGDAPKVVMAAATIEDCFYSVLTARKIAETFRLPVVVLSDANLATGQQPFRRPEFSSDWLAPPIDQRPVPDDAVPFDWDERTGLSKRLIPGQPGGMHTLTGLAHTRDSKVAYSAEVNQRTIELRSRKLAALQQTLKTPEVNGDPEGDLLVVGCGSTKGAIDEALEIARQEGFKISALHLRFIQPMAPGIGEILKRFQRVLTVEINHADTVDGDIITEDNRRYSNLAWLLRARYLVDVQCFSQVRGAPIKPGDILIAMRNHLSELATVN